MRQITILFAALLLLPTGAALAQETLGNPLEALTLDETGDTTSTSRPSVARIDSIAYAPIPPGARLITQPETQGEMDDSAWRLANDDLAARGYQVGNDGNLVFTVETQLVDRLSSDQTQNSLLSQSAVADGMQYSTNQRTLLNPEAPVNRNDRVFRVNATVYDRGSGAFLWRGTAERSSAAIDPESALRLMLPALLDHFGQNAEGVVVPAMQ